jgi:Family of unknown function (DUF6220)
MRSLRTVGRAVFLGASWILVAGLVVQVFLAGLGVFESQTRFMTHRYLGYTLELLPLAMVVSGLAGGLGRRLVGLSALILGLFLAQSVFVAVRTEAPMVAALHPVNGFLILLLSIVVARGAALRRTQPEPEAHGRAPEADAGT